MWEPGQESQHPSTTSTLLLGIWGHLSRRRRIQLGLLLVVMLASGGAELVSLGAVLPFLAVLSDPERLWQQPLVQALAGQSRAGAGAEPFEDALRLFESREDYDFNWGAISTESVSLTELARAARVLGREDEARSLYERAVAAGSLLARDEIDG